MQTNPFDYQAQSHNTLSAIRSRFPQRLFLSAALVGSFSALSIPTQAAPAHQHHSATTTHAARLAQHAKHTAKLAAQHAKLAMQHKALAQHQAHLLRLAHIFKLRQQEAKIQHQQKLALLKSALRQQMLAQQEVRMQQALTTKAKRLALHQQKQLMKLHKARLQMAARRHKTAIKMARLRAQHEALTSGNVVMAAYTLRGSRYVMGGTSRAGFDCSGFVRYVLSTADGVAIPRTAAEQYYHGAPIPVQKMEPGDLVFFKNTYKHGISHVGIYAGQGKFIHAANAHKGVRIDVLNSAYYWRHFAGARRVLPAQMRQAAFLR